MSIREQLAGQIKAGQLCRLKPALDAIPRERTVVLSREIHDHLMGPWVDGDEEATFQRLRADLDDFIGGEPVTVASNPRKAKSAFLNRLEECGGKIWELRQRKPKPGIRLIGGFLERDFFVGFHLSARLSLGEFGSEAWGIAIRDTKAAWRKQFLTWPAIGDACKLDGSIHEYISKAILV
jgi:hypothetical protein